MKRRIAVVATFQPAKPENSAKSPSWLELLGKIAGILGLLYAYLFFEGWVYLSSMFEQFNIDDVWALDLPAYTYPLHSILVLWKIKKIAIITVLVVFLSVIYLTSGEIYWTARWISETYKKIARLSFRTLVVVLLVYFLFSIILIWASNKGSVDGQWRWDNSPHALLSFKGAEHQPGDLALKRANDEHRLCLLFETKDLVLVFEQAKEKRSDKRVYVLNRSDLGSLLISP